MFLMALFNIVGVYLLASKVKKELNKYLKLNLVNKQLIFIITIVI